MAFLVLPSSSLSYNFIYNVSHLYIIFIIIYLIICLLSSSSLLFCLICIYVCACLTCMSLHIYTFSTITPCLSFRGGEVEIMAIAITCHAIWPCVAWPAVVSAEKSPCTRFSHHLPTHFGGGRGVQGALLSLWRHQHQHSLRRSLHKASPLPPCHYPHSWGGRGRGSAI